MLRTRMQIEAIARVIENSTVTPESRDRALANLRFEWKLVGLADDLKAVIDSGRPTVGQAIKLNEAIDVLERIVMGTDIGDLASETPMRDPFIEPEPVMPRPDPVTKSGMYQTDNGQIYRVQLSCASGQFYAKRLYDDPGVTPHFIYAPGAIRNLRASQRMTQEQAAEYGRRTGTCCVCSAELTDPASIARGIGPICMGRL